MQQPAEHIGRYRVDSLIGQGAMGAVYLAWDAMIQRRVAIKVLRMDRLATEEDRTLARKLFLKEARISGNLNHSHITAVYDMGLHQGAPFMVMEYIEGQNIRQLMDQGIHFLLRDKLPILVMVARALHYAHQHSVLHRDVKPANIVIQRNRLPKITDFGIASVMGRGGSGKFEAEDGQILGTPHYMSPEQVRGEELDARTDIYSLGVLAHEWISGKKPFTGSDLREILKNILEAEPPSLNSVSEADVKLAAIVRRAMARDIRKRYQSAEEFSDALEVYIHQAGMEGCGGGRSLVDWDKLETVNRLKKNYVFFADFTPEELLGLFKLSAVERFESGDYLIREGATGSTMYIIISGGVSVVNEAAGREIELERLGGGACVGEMAIIDRMPRSASVVAREPTLAIAINETVLRLSNPVLCLKLLRNMAAMISEKLRHSTARYRELVAKVEKEGGEGSRLSRTKET